MTYDDLKPGDIVTFKTGYWFEVLSVRDGAQPTTVRITAHEHTPTGATIYSSSERTHKRATRVEGTVTR